MARRLLTLAVFGLSVSMAGCVPMDKYQALKLEKETLAEQLNAAQAEAARNKAAADTFEKNYNAMLAQGNSLTEQNAKLNEELALIRAQNASLEERYKHALDDKGQIVVNQSPLPAPLNAALADFARQYPNLLEFDASRGLVKFKSDVTFPSGSSDLGSQAKEAIAKFGQLLNSPTFQNYEFFVAGHTDNTPVHNPRTIAAGNRDNWYLSCNRAISVAHDLIAQGISQKRIGVQGFADQRPVAPNTTADGKARNRRVEVVILPNTVQGGPTQTASNETPAPRKAITAPKPDFNKDSDVRLNTGPVFNK